jgi:hypothetical protein
MEIVSYRAVQCHLEPSSTIMYEKERQDEWLNEAIFTKLSKSGRGAGGQPRLKIVSALVHCPLDP